MARPHRPPRGNSYEKRRSQRTAPPPVTDDNVLTSRDARALGDEITESQSRYHVAAIRLRSGSACELVLTDTRTGGEHVLTAAQDWQRLQARPAD